MDFWRFFTFLNFIIGNGIGIIPKVINIVSKITILSDSGIPKKKLQNGGHNMAPKVNFYL